MESNRKQGAAGEGSDTGSLAPDAGRDKIVEQQEIGLPNPYQFKGIAGRVEGFSDNPLGLTQAMM